MQPDPVWWPLRAGESLNRWLVTAPESEIYPGVARPHPDQVDYRFVNGWVATGDLPCREAFRKLLPRLDPVPPAAAAFSEVYLGGENPRVDFTTFCFRPTRIARFARALVRADEAQSAGFEIETCGAVHVWLDGRKVAVHQPLDRNIPHTARIDLALPAGVSEITVRLEDLHERDTSCFFRLGLVSGQGLSAGIRADVDPARLKDVEKTLAALRTTRLFHQEGKLAVVCDHGPAEPVEVVLHDGQSADGSATMNVLADRLPLPGPVRFTVTRAGEVHELFDVAGIPPGCYALSFSVEAGAVRLQSGLGTTIMGDVARLGGADLAARKAEARTRIAAEPGTSISRALLLLQEGGAEEEVARIFRHTLTGIDERHDCADFWILPLIWAWRDHAGSGLPQPLWDEVRRAILNFRYWLDEPGNDVMWFWSENHAFCFHVAQFLAGDTFPGEVFPNSGRTGAGHREAARARLHRWFDSVEDHGLAEWNSSCYYPIDLLGLFTLEACSPDAGLKARAKALIDSIFVMTALHSLDGMPVGSQGRVYEKELFAGPATELGAVAAIAFGGIWCPGHERAAALFAVSDYAPPAACSALHRLEGHDRLEARYVQGLNQNAKLALWKTAAVQLSAVTGHRTGDPGHQQHVAEIQFAAHPLARSWISHPGELKVWGGGRPSYWMANGTVPRVCMAGNAAALVYDLDRHAHPVRFTHLFAPAELLDDCTGEGQWLFQRIGEGYAAIWASAPMERLETGLYKGQEWRCHGAQAGWLMVAGSAATHGSFAGFRDAALALAPAFDAAALRLDWQADGARLSASFSGGLLRDGAAEPFAPLSVTPHAGFDGAPLKAVEF
ncbi:hypothetical protein [Poseidonocella sp. HB161398]|uniref:hypothetical protein n=1 Tax=Poseidonocella sp. HB161398 TaxID=2320855 RepID=UPI001109491E|nr:hypothetical protein [Poseidonocella sp. HB161398]